MAEPKPPKKRYLTKTRYKLATECPTKLYYTGKKEYANQKNEDSFLAALAEGGFQVGALAKLYIPNGVEVASRDHEISLNETNELLKSGGTVRRLFHPRGYPGQEGRPPGPYRSKSKINRPAG